MPTEEKVAVAEPPPLPIKHAENRIMYTIGVAGGSGAGKSTVSRKLFHSLGGDTNVSYLLHDSYYRDQSHKDFDERCRTNYDHPQALETELLLQHIKRLKQGEVVEVPTYDFAAHNRAPNAIQLVGPRPILLIEGILIFCEPELMKEMDLTVFVVSRPKQDTFPRGTTLSCTCSYCIAILFRRMQLPMFVSFVA